MRYSKIGLRSWFRFGIVMILGAGALLAATGCSSASSAPYTKTDFAMGTVIQQTIYGTEGEKTAEAVMERLKDMENRQLSWRVAGSEVAQINEAAGSGTWVAVDSEVEEWLRTTLQLAADTEGAIDPTIGPIARLWDIGGDHPRVPKEQEIRKALKEVDYQMVAVSEDGVRLSKKGQQLDLGALGKGIADDAVRELLEEQESVDGAVISVGGSIEVYGQKPDKSPWKVGIQDPRGENEGDTMGYVTTDRACSISSSGDYEKYIMVDGRRYHHIMDPHTGKPADSGIIATTVICDSGIMSDGLSTACFILGYEKSLPLLEKYKAEAMFIDQDKNIYMTDGMKEKFTLTNTDYTIVQE